jgi:hypothetical protein
MRRLGVLLTTAAVGLLAGQGSAGAVAPHFSRTSARTAGNELEIDFVERGLVPGQNYAYVASSSKVTQTFRCYRSSTFTPLHHKFRVSTVDTSPDVRGYTADADGVVRGFVFVTGVFPTVPDECTGPDREAVLIHITFTDYELSDIFTHSFADVTGIFSGPVEPD